MDRFKEVKEALREAWLSESSTAQHESAYQVFVDFVKQNQTNVALFVLFVSLAIRQIVSKNREAAKKGANRQFLEAPDFPEVETLENFDWKKEDTVKLRAFKPKFHLTMDFSDESAIQNLNPSELITMDRTYSDRIAYRKRIIRESGDVCIGVNDDKRVGPAVRELYTFLLGTYLPKRFPNMFKLHYASFETGTQFMFENLITKQVFPAQPAQVTSTRILLQTLGSIVDEDFLFLLPEEDSEDPKYTLEAYVCICPSGWNPPDKLGRRLAAIHGPVPGYADKLEGSMDRYFKSLEVGKYVRRSNWSITQHEELFSPDPNTNHGKADSEEKALTEVDPGKTFLRTERQTLHRLPSSKAIVFAFKTYMDTLRDIKLEGLGDDLADAIDGLKTGNAPAMNVYKRGPVWGEAVKGYLRS
ncbi:hypothetical protein OHC33_008385 [Knufia fluminis]|uniref:Uncharacterized protein n=1 Tax=Knufia fluminis TaxID=191047 RepID=A0AAN8EGS0_9EURO|nr:hypothetical protein OHC33_008385 [Knufia fluminis]